MAKRGSGEGTIFEDRPGRWIAVITTGYEFKDGKRRRVRKKFVGATRGEVNEKLVEALDKHRRGINVAPEKITLGQFLEAWLEHTVKPNLRPKTYRSYEQMVRNHLIKKPLPPVAIEAKPKKWKVRKPDGVPGIGLLKPRSLTVDRLGRFLNAKLAAGNSPALVRYLRTVLRIALNEAIRRDMVEKNVAELVRPPHVPKPDIEPFGADEAHSLLAAVQGHRLEALFTVALAIGLRHGEALALQWSEVDLADGTLNVFHTLQRVSGKLQRTPPKSEESHRVVPLPPIGVGALKAILFT